MKTKIYFTAMLVLGIMGIGNAQAANAECTTNLSIFVEHAKVKNYDAAYKPWKMVYDECPELNWATFVYGERILKDKIKKSSGAEKEGFITDFLELTDNSMKYFPKKAKMAEGEIDKVLMKYDNKMISTSEIYAALDHAFKEDRENFTNPKALYLYFSSLVDLNATGEKELQEVFDVYDDVTEKIEEENKKFTDRIAKLLPKEEEGTLTSKEKKRLKSYNSYSENYGKISGSIDTKLGQLAECDNLIPLYQKSFEEKKGDVKWVKRAVSRMFQKECIDDPLFVKLVEEQKNLDPSADIYLYLGQLKLKSGDTKGAVADFNKALELETDSYKKSNIAYKVATIYRRGSKSTARSYAQKAINANAANGKAYLLIANLYATSANACGKTSFEKRAIYWKAAEMARKAGRVDPSLSGRASTSATSYAAKAPTKEMIFTEGMAGKTVTFSCWVGGSVKVPSL
ncbi:tetratricopeptide repeat protein [Maribacter sp. 2-571]|uniref:tetratricopeptide repeat protein n=1 Tax=Maribacter sp. 2-571 TaxID=3417569 RepID=UPI003D33F966